MYSLNRCGLGMSAQIILLAVLSFAYTEGFIRKQKVKAKLLELPDVLLVQIYRRSTLRIYRTTNRPSRQLENTIMITRAMIGLEHAQRV